MKAFYAARPEIPPERDPPGSNERYGIYQMRLLEIMRERLLPLEATFDRRAADYRGFIEDARFGSPLLLFHDLSTSAAGTHTARLEDFPSADPGVLRCVGCVFRGAHLSRARGPHSTPTFKFSEPPFTATAGHAGLSLLEL